MNAGELVQLLLVDNFKEYKDLKSASDDDALNCVNMIVFKI